MMNQTARRGVRGALLAVASVGGALVLAEILLRRTGLAFPGGVATMTEPHFRRLPGTYAPNQRVVSRDVPALPHTVTIDSLGYRGAGLSRSKPAGETRILFLGDSFTYGSYVDDSVTVPALVDARLRQSCSSVRVVNAGLGGSTITDQARIAERGLALTPDIAIVMFSENDVTDLAQVPMWDRLAVNRARKSRFPVSLIYRGLRQTAIWNLVLRAKARRDSAQAPAPDQPARTQDRVLQGRYASALRGLRDSLARHGVPLAFAAMPTHLTLEPDGSLDQYQWVLSLADSLGLPRADILGAMRSSGLPPEALYLLPHDGHASSRGNAVAATAIAPVLAGMLEARGQCSGAGP